MGTGISGFYDDFAANYHLLFEDWEASIIRQAAAVASILERECLAAGTTVLDCACGIGDASTRALAKLGFLRNGSGCERWRHRARSFRSDGAKAEDPVLHRRHAKHVLPHLHSDADLTRAAGQIRAKLRIGGAFVASMRDYDEILVHYPVTQAPAFYSDEGKRRIVFQVWDWHDDRRYTFPLCTSFGKHPPAGRTSTGRRRIARSCAMRLRPFWRRAGSARR